MFRFRRFLTPLLIASVVALIAWPVYASCKKCKSEAQEMISVMESSSLTLTSAIAAAEKRSRGGKPLSAYALFEDGKVTFQVFLLKDEKVMRVDVGEDGRGKKVEEADTLPSIHDPIAHKPKPRRAG